MVLQTENENSNHPEEKKSLREDFDESATADELDDSKVKFLNGGKRDLEDPHVVVEVGSDVSFTGLGKEELMQYANDPFWVRLRMILFIIFWVGWIAMLVAAIVIIVVAPKCPERPDLKWYQTETLYQVNPKSFRDTSKQGDLGAGVGDIKGINNKVGYLQDLGANAIWINAFYKAGAKSYDGNDVVDHTMVDELYGTMADFDALRKATKKKGMKLVLDFIPNHTGKKSEWFIKSQSKDAEYADFYIWADGAGSDPANTPPNNWVTEYGKPAWQYDATRKQWYYYSYLPEYPDLNLRNPVVLAKLDGVLRFWLDKGVDGFAVQGLQRLVEFNDTTQDESSAGDKTVDQEENLALVRRWRGIMNSYSDKPGRERALFANINAVGNNTKLYHGAGIHVVITDVLSTIDPASCDSACFVKTITEAQMEGVWMGWMLNNEDTMRFGSRVERKLQPAFQALHLLLPGTAIVYYGDEIGMTSGAVKPAAETIKDPLTTVGMPSRSSYRLPMMWTSKENAGFCDDDVTPWLPVNPDNKSTSVEYNNAHMVGYTILNSFHDLQKLREKESIQFGSFEIKLLNNEVVYFTRKAPGFPSYLVAINRGGKSAGLASVADQMSLVYDSNGSDDVGSTFDTKHTPIGFSAAGEVYVFEY